MSTTLNPTDYETAQPPEPKDLEVPLIKPTVGGMRATRVRWLCLFFACFTCVGDYYCNNLTQALQHYLMIEFDIDNLKFNTLSSVSSVPSVILPFVGGILIDKFGIRSIFFIFCTVVIIGQIIMTVGVAKLNFELLLVSKVIFAIGAGPLIVAKSAVLVKWFVGKELSLALGAALCVSRLGSSIDSIISPKVYEWTGNLATPFFVGIIVCVMSLGAVMCVNYLDAKLDREEPASQKEAQPFSLKEILKAKRIFFMIALNVALLYAGFFGFTNNLNDHMVTRFGFTPAQAGAIIPVIYICPSAITPFFGTLVDKIGKRVIMIFIASCIFLVSHFFIAFIPDAPEGTTSYTILWGLVGVGIFYSIYAAVIWPCIALVIEEKLTGLGYGFTNSSQSLIMIIVPLILGKINVSTADFKGGYFWSQIFLAGIVIAGTLVTIFVYLEDMKHGGRLNNPGTERERAKSIRAKSFIED